MTQEIINEIRTAYADAGEQREDPAYVHEMRCLSFLASDWLTPTEAADAVSYIGGYNRFDPDTVTVMLDAIEDLDPNALVAVGREGSPALYIETDVAEDVVAVLGDDWENEDADPPWNNGSPDELSVVDVVSNYRKDWYQDDDRDVHSMCAHESPPVPVEEFAEADPNREHVRAWWD